jgi:ATP-binding cassette subfamily A (ABC1) protein 3
MEVLPSVNLIVLSGLPMSFSARRFDSEGELEDYVRHDDYDSNSMPGVCAGIVIEESGNNFDVKLRFDDNYLVDSDYKKQQIPTTKKDTIDPLNPLPDEEAFEMYHTSGFTYLQYLVLKVLGGTSINSLKVGVMPMKTPEYIDDEFLNGPGLYIGGIMILSFLAPIFKIVSMIVQDKENKTREGMKIMGLKDCAYWISFATYYFVILTVIALIISTLMVTVIFDKSNWFLIFIYFLEYGLAVLAFGFCMSTFFHRARIGSIAVAIIYICLYSISNFILSDDISSSMNDSSKIALCLLPPIAMIQGSTAIAKLELGKEGLTFSAVDYSINNFQFSYALIMLAVDIVIYTILGLYLDSVVPSPSGVRKPLYFFLTPEFWSSGKTASAKKAENERNTVLLYPNGQFERVGEELKAQESAEDCLKIRHLNKFFGQKQSVCDFSLNLYKGQIFALLGPNGAGKTTTISMLSGLLPPTSGEATISNIEVFKRMDVIRSMLGVCPQHDVLFDKLTPREHLEIFAAFKGRASVEKEINEILDDIELNNCVNVIAEKLSGGQRRKLSIGMSFVGNSDIIFLDEPTSGIDINSRKGVWSMLKKYKQDKIIILTTHYMEEAEELGDRIGIMTHGTLKCVGTPLFLKTVYGAGYNLTVSCEDAPESKLSGIQSKITDHLQKSTKEISVKKAKGKEIVYFLPNNQAKDLKELFTDLDKNLKTLNIQSYAIATNSLEEIFLQVASEDEVVESHKQKYAIEMPMNEQELTSNNSELESYSIANDAKDSCCSSFGTHFMAIIMKRIYLTYRNWGSLIIDIVVPVLLVLLGLILTLISLYYDSDPRWLSGNLYPTPQSILLNSADSSNVNTNSFTQYFGSYLRPSDHSITFANAADKNALLSMESVVYDQRTNDRYGSLFINKLDTVSKDYEYIVFANLWSQDSAGAFMGYFGQALLRLVKNDPAFNINFINYPLPISSSGQGKEKAKNGELMSSFIAVAFSLIPASVIIFIVQERETSLKHQQVITGVSLIGYWAANCVIDTIKSLIPCTISIGIISAFDIELDDVWLLMIIYCFTIIPFTYAMSFLFTKENVAQTFTLLFHFFISVAITVIVIILRSFDGSRSAGKIVQWIFRIVPSFALADGVNTIFYKEFYALLENKAVEDNLSFAVAGGNVLFLAIFFPISILLIMFFESPCFASLMRCCKPAKIENSEFVEEKNQLVLNEEKYCDSISLQDSPPFVLARHLSKVYKLNSEKSIMAVDNISFAVNKGECLALLGTNGAGKTTTFKMLTRDVPPTHGEIFINGNELEANFADIRKTIGYGPQYESAFMSMTVRENLTFYAMLKGIPKRIRDQAINKLIVDMDLVEFEHVLVGNLSGGNKRKTTVAIALLGNPPIVLLDEPSTGVDPQAKRFMWQIIQRISTTSKNTAVILTTHSMEEAEALCTKMAIMTSGNFQCIGRPQELKEIFGKGYEIQISIPPATQLEETAFLAQMNLAPETDMNLEEVNQLFDKADRSELKVQLDPKGNAAHILTEINTKGSVKARMVANYLILQSRGVEIGEKLAEEFGEAKVPEHIGNFFKFRVDKIDEKQTIGFLFGLLQGVVEKYHITQYSASQTSLNQIFQTLAKQANYGLSGNQRKE